MARVRRCDRCGRYYEPYMHKPNAIATGTFNLDNEEETTVQWMDLCPSCMNFFEAYVKAVEYHDIGSTEE